MAQLAVVTSQEPEVRSHSGYRLVIEPGLELRGALRRGGDGQRHIAFYWDRIDAWFEDGEQVIEPPPATPAATADPLLDWAMRDAWQATTAQELIEKLALRLVATGPACPALRRNLRSNVAEASAFPHEATCSASAKSNP